jgi:hypothetical protein
VVLLILCMIAVDLILYREYSDIEKLEQIRKDAGADSSISNSATVALTRDGKDDKVDASNCLFSQCLIL